MSSRCRRSLARVAGAGGWLAVLGLGAACGGKIWSPPGSGEADDAGVFIETDASGPFVTSVTPDAGPNVGGALITVHGRGFVPGDSLITLQDIPLLDASCTSATECSGLTPFPNLQDFDQKLDVQVTTHVSLGDAGLQRSPLQPLDLYTYLSGPQCGFQLSCQDRTAYPAMVITCPTSVTFYALSGDLPSTAVGMGTTYSAGTEDFYTGLVACFGDAKTTSCSTYVSIAHPWDCGAADFCYVCQKLGGACVKTTPPQCWK